MGNADSTTQDVLCVSNVQVKGSQGVTIEANCDSVSLLGICGSCPFFLVQALTAVFNTTFSLALVFNTDLSI